MQPLCLPEQAFAIIRHHHEHYDGTGYPGGLAGEAIPRIARVVAVADALEAMTSERPYRPALGREAALAESERGSGGQFDPEVSAAVLGAAQSDAARRRKGRLWYLSDEQLRWLIEDTRSRLNAACDDCADRDTPNHMASCPILYALESDMDAWLADWAVP